MSKKEKQIFVQPLVDELSNIEDESTVTETDADLTVGEAAANAEANVQEDEIVQTKANVQENEIVQENVPFQENILFQEDEPVKTQASVEEQLDESITGEQQSNAEEKAYNNDGSDLDDKPYYDAKTLKLVKIKAMLGESRFVSFFTVFNIAVYAFWIIAYVICLVSRNAMLKQIAIQQAAQGVTDFSMQVTSPMFSVLTVLLYLLPVFSIIWALGIKSADKKDKIICAKKIIIIALCIIFVTGIVAVFDVTVAHMLF